MKIYLDMDDVVADFKGYAERKVGQKLPLGGRFRPEVWREIVRNPRIYKDLPVKEGAHELVRWCHEYCIQNNCELLFLTALPRNNDVPYAIWDKVCWAKKHFPGIPVMMGPYSKDKWQHCKEGDILIDDRNSNCKEWEAAGGRAFQYRNWSECKSWLIETLL
jgi:5'(3')-deoxyribonucleotidase